MTPLGFLPGLKGEETEGREGKEVMGSEEWQRGKGNAGDREEVKGSGGRGAHIGS